jgi:outer membrane protease
MNIVPKSFFVIIFCLFGAPPSLFGVEEAPKKLFSYSIETTVGFFYGQSEEIVYKDSNGAYLSELLWDMKPLLYYGTALSLELQIPSCPVSFYTDLSTKIGIAGRSGFIEDRDWLHPDFLTNYSIHNCSTYDSRFFDVDIGVSIPLRPGKTFNPALSFFIRFSYMKMKWIAWDGYIQYGDNYTFYYPEETDHFVPWDDSFKKIGTSGSILMYSQSCILLSPGFTAIFPLSRFFTLNYSFTITPLVFTASEDLHLLADTQFLDYPQGGLALEPEIRTLFFLNSRCSLSLRVSWRYIAGAVGYSWRKKGIDSDSGYISQGKSGGAGFHALNTGLSFKVYF